jgi:hypothetical protein
MKKKISWWAALVSFAILGFNFLLIFLLPETFPDDLLIMILGLVIWLLLSSLLAVSALMLIFRRFFSGWPAWVLVVVISLLFSYLISGNLTLPAPISMLVGLAWLVSSLEIGLTTVLLLWKRDVSIQLMGGTLVIGIWVMIIAWRIQGGFLGSLIDSTSRQNPTAALWWFNTLLCTIGWSFAVGIPAFLYYSFKILMHEFQPESQQAAKHVFESRS